MTNYICKSLDFCSLCNFANLCKTGFVLNISERNQILIFKCLVCSCGQCWWSVSSLGSEAPQVVSHIPQQSRESWGLCRPLSVPHCAIVKVERSHVPSQSGSPAGARCSVVGDFLWMNLFCTTGYSRIFPSQAFGTPCAQ